jgi:methylenetetrahydrofolate dehydrogenase (NADP+) / methenyltetrahydrofolate cyclohydrolase
MSARLLEGKPVADALRARIQADVESFRQAKGCVPCIATVMVGDDEASAVYARRIARVHDGLGMASRHVTLPEGTSAVDLSAAMADLSADPVVSGILPLLPLPAPLTVDDVLGSLSPEKDVDGIHPVNAGRLYLGQDTFVPNTPAGGMEMLDYYRIELQGRRAVVVGRSNIVGKPMALLLLARHATVTLCHSRTVALPEVAQEGDILVAAVGRAKMVKGDWLKPGAVVVDFGINSVEGGITGDVDFESASQVAGAITPVPGGTGPVTNLMLARNTLKAAKRQAGLADGAG